MSRKGVRNGEQHGGAHGRAHADICRTLQARLISSSGISLGPQQGGSGRTTVEVVEEDHHRHRPVVTTSSRQQTAATGRISPTAVDFQDGETTQQCSNNTARRPHHHEEEGETDEEREGNNNKKKGLVSFSPSLSSLVLSSLSPVLQCPLKLAAGGSGTTQTPSCSDIITTNRSSSSNNTIITTTTVVDKKLVKTKSKKTAFLLPCSGNNNNNNINNIINNTNNRKTTSISRRPPNSDSSISLKTITSVTNNNNMAIHNLQYLSSNSSSASDYDYDEEEDDVEEEEEGEDEVVEEDLGSYERSVVETSSEWFKTTARCRNLDSVVGFELVDHHHHQSSSQSVVDTLDIVTGKSGKDIVVDDLFSGEHLAVSPDPAGVIPPLAGTDHVVLSTTEHESVVLYNTPSSSSDSNNGHSIVLNGVENNTSITNNPNNTSVTLSTKTCAVVGNTGLNNCPVSSSPSSSQHLSRSAVSSISTTCTSTINSVCTTPTTIITNPGVVVLDMEGRRRGNCTSSSTYPSVSSSSSSSSSTVDTMGHHHQPTDGQESMGLRVPLLEFKRVGTDKSNTLMTPQELESMPDQGIEFEESVGPKQEITSSSTLPSCLDPDHAVSLSVIPPPPSPQNSTPPRTNMLETPVQVSTPNLATTTTTITTNNKNTNNLCSPTSSVVDSLLDNKPVLIIDNNGRNPLISGNTDTPPSTNTTASKNNSCSITNTINSSTTIPSTTSSKTLTSASGGGGVTNALNTNLFNSGNFTLATISISTDRSTNSTQILVNTNQGQQLYHINTADLTKAQTLPTSQPVAPTPSTQVTTATTAVSTTTTTNSSRTVTNNGASPQTGYLLLPMTPADNKNDILITNPVNNGQVKEEPPDPLQWPLDVKDEIGDDADADADSKSDSPSEPTSVKKVWPCEQAGCEQVFKKLSKLKIHLMRHTGERPFRCNQPGCDWAFTTAYKLKRHVESHIGRKDYICDIDGCGRKFTTIYNLNSHKKLHERPCNEVCPKPNCDQRFPTKRQLDLHLKNHTDVEKTYKCPVEGCDKVFLSPNCMGSHARVHQQDRDELICKYEGCGKMFSKVCRLKLHMRCHTGEKPYQCRFDGCTWAFATASKLKRHMSKHTGVRKWLCNACGKAFMRAEHLKGHMVKHSGTKPFQCSVDGCKTRFTAKSSLYIHLKKHDHSGEKIIYPCPMERCEKKYSTKVSLRNHIMKHYNPNNTSAPDSSHFDLVPLMVTDDMNETQTLDSLGQQTVNQATPVSGVSINNALSNSIMGTTDPVLIGSSDYVSTDSEKLLSVAVNSAPLFSPAESLPQHGITLRDPETGITYVQTQLLQDDPPNPEIYPGESSLVSDLSLHDATSTTTGDTVSEPGVSSSSEFTGTTINLQDLE